MHDTRLSARARHASLRTCVVMFAPYGFRATYHHLCRSAGVPARLESDPGALVRAVEELQTARVLWLEDEAAYVARRRREKASGRRDTRADGSWRDVGRGSGGSLVHCPDPGFHPTEPLPVVAERVLGSTLVPGEAPACRACVGNNGVVRWFNGREVYELCRVCGVALDSRDAEPDPVVLQAGHERWARIWGRTL
ncbi:MULTISPECIES: hypothetical protein [unclassified Streptomyces]|uniref:GATA-type domain-containing protein n=1 Tax=Streptomyces sp. NBC_00060 TaxID=2975636 RepID=A0AAU2H8Y7_9ACTN